MNSLVSKYLAKMRDELLEYLFVSRQIAEGHCFLKTKLFSMIPSFYYSKKGISFFFE
ncbi:MAG: hypothetical protein HEEMFOPI_01828 [Holosporales bacterium]